jgi:hypothetical protein
MFLAKEDRQRIVYYLPGDDTATSKGVNVKHTVVRIQLGGEEFAFDVASAQYGHYRTVTPWKAYVQELCGPNGMTVLTCGVTKTSMEETLRAWEIGGELPRTMLAQDLYLTSSLADKIKYEIGIICKIDTKSHKPFAAVLRQRRADFDQQVVHYRLDMKLFGLIRG